ncbi:hypothetical protein AAG570_012308 [Ranatra chinensis]|uniref:Uncharacterized protein n=1 Tax=Ranatra chinensis TaxID=642074 RepID=A0ABD0YIF1_9HEMI
MASKRRNMFHKNKTQETTEKGFFSYFGPSVLVITLPVRAFRFRLLVWLTTNCVSKSEYFEEYEESANYKDPGYFTSAGETAEHYHTKGAESPIKKMTRGNANPKMFADIGPGRDMRGAAYPGDSIGDSTADVGMGLEGVIGRNEVKSYSSNRRSKRLSRIDIPAYHGYPADPINSDRMRNKRVASGKSPTVSATAAYPGREFQNRLILSGNKLSQDSHGLPLQGVDSIDSTKLFGRNAVPYRLENKLPTAGIKRASSKGEVPQPNLPGAHTAKAAYKVDDSPGKYQASEKQAEINARLTSEEVTAVRSTGEPNAPSLDPMAGVPEKEATGLTLGTNDNLKSVGGPGDYSAQDEASLLKRILGYPAVSEPVTNESQRSSPIASSAPAAVEGNVIAQNDKAEESVLNLTINKSLGNDPSLNMVLSSEGDGTAPNSGPALKPGEASSNSVSVRTDLAKQTTNTLDGAPASDAIDDTLSNQLTDTGFEKGLTQSSFGADAKSALNGRAGTSDSSGIVNVEGLGASNNTEPGGEISKTAQPITDNRPKSFKLDSSLVPLAKSFDGPSAGAAVERGHDDEELRTTNKQFHNKAVDKDEMKHSNSDGKSISESEASKSASVLSPDKQSRSSLPASKLYRELLWRLRQGDRGASPVSAPYDQRQKSNRVKSAVERLLDLDNPVRGEDMLKVLEGPMILLVMPVKSVVGVAQDEDSDYAVVKVQKRGPDSTAPLNGAPISPAEGPLEQRLVRMIKSLARQHNRGGIKTPSFTFL